VDYLYFASIVKSARDVRSDRSALCEASASLSLVRHGVESGRRYVAIDGHPKFFNFYEMETINTLVSTAYRHRLDNPTDWTRRASLISLI
jgi:hypothetical protein